MQYQALVDMLWQMQYAATLCIGMQVGGCCWLVGQGQGQG